MSDRDAHLLLVGMMGAGKTTVGRLVAERLGRPYRDSDAMVEEATGHSVPELFAQGGEASFRAAEAAALRRAVEPPPAVISVAGGAVLDPNNRALLQRSGTVVWLRAHPATLAARVGGGDGRPLLAPDPPGALAELDSVRRPLYEAVADAVVDVDELEPAQVADAVLLAAGAR
ncbi:MAG TPA: shikimate kinase [Acidimicrobiales bacterium]|nr:shikimate kinase [Acidimicrobiales bacterium]